MYQKATSMLLANQFYLLNGLSAGINADGDMKTLMI
jgi:hypothetical protein